MMTLKRRIVSAVCTLGLLGATLFVLPGCDSGSSSETGTIKPSAEQQAAIDKANKETAAAHKRDVSKKRH